MLEQLFTMFQQIAAGEKDIIIIGTNQIPFEFVFYHGIDFLPGQS